MTVSISHVNSVNATVENTSNEVAYRTTREGNESLQYEPNQMMALPTFRSQGGVSLPRTHTSLACDWEMRTGSIKTAARALQ